MIQRIKCGVGNAYIVSQGGSAILVDTGTAAFKRRILRACRGKNIRLVVLTHGHYDHAQNAAFLARELGVPVAMHPADVPLLGDILAEPLEGAHPVARLLIGILNLSTRAGFRWIGVFFRNKPFEAAIDLHDGFSFVDYGVEARAVALPGHTRGSIGVVAGDGLLAGDALTNLLPPPGKAALYGDRAAVQESAARVSAMGDMMVWFGHGKPAKNREW